MEKAGFIEGAGEIINALSRTPFGVNAVVCLGAFGLVGWVVWVLRPRDRRPR